jgi:hypothetical protein
VLLLGGALDLALPVGVIAGDEASTEALAIGRIKPHLRSRIQLIRHAENASGRILQPVPGIHFNSRPLA